MLYSYRKTALCVIVFTLIISILLLLVAYRSYNTKTDMYYLREYNGTVALFKNDDIMEVYNGVIVNNLPFSDQSRLKEGIKVAGAEEAQVIIEDYDG